MAGVPAGLPAGIRLSDHISLGVIARAVPPERVRQVLEETGRASERERAVSLYYAVRDGIRYNPFLDFSQDGAYRASTTLERGEGFCVGKSALLAHAITSAPRFFAIWTHAVPTPPLAPRISTRSPARTWPRVVSMRQAVP